MRASGEGGGGHPEVGHPVGAVDVAGIDRLLEEGPESTHADGHVGRPRGLEDDERVAARRRRAARCRRRR